MTQLYKPKGKPFSIVECQNPHEAFAIESEERIIGWIANSLGEDGKEYISDEDRAIAHLIAALPVMKEALEIAELELAILNESWPDDHDIRIALNAVQHALFIADNKDNGGE